MKELMHVKPSLEYKDAAIGYINEFYEYGSEINGVGGLYKYLDDYEGWLVKLEEDRTMIANEEIVPAETYFLVRKEDNKIVGMINIRLELNENLRKCGGHIGYSIRPSERRKGYNKINLYHGLLTCKEHDIKEALLWCKKSNLGSARSMQALGGKLIKEEYNEHYGEMVQEYAIDVEESVKKYEKVYK